MGTLAPRRDPDNEQFWMAASERRFVAQRCSDCASTRFYPRLLCPRCHSDRAEWSELSGLGSLHSFSVVRRAPSPEFADAVPYVVALIDLDEGIRVFSNIIDDVEDISIGDRVRVVFRELEDGSALPVFTLDTDRGGRA